MEEENNNDSFPDLKELENKVGRKTPESLLVWMRDAADCEDGWRSDVVDRGNRSFASSDSFSEKISNLKQEMRWLRSADVRILRQLVAVHEGIEAMRWLMEERDALASHSSSLTGSLSSLLTVEEHGPYMSPCRESLSPTLDLIETAGEESEDHPPLTDHNILSHESTEARPPSLSTSTSHGHTSSRPANSLVIANMPMSHSRHSDVAPLQHIKSSPDAIRKALLRSNRARREVKVDNGSFALTKQPEETQTETEVRTQESFRASQNNLMEKDESAPSIESSLLGYDAQWCWVESQDDVTFL